MRKKLDELESTSGTGDGSRFLGVIKTRTRKSIVFGVAVLGLLIFLATLI